MKEGTPTAIRFTEEDVATMRKLEKLTGLSGATQIIRMALREALATWEKKRSKK